MPMGTLSEKDRLRLAELIRAPLVPKPPPMPIMQNRPRREAVTLDQIRNHWREYSARAVALRDATAQRFHVWTTSERVRQSRDCAVKWTRHIPEQWRERAIQASRH